MTVNDSDGIQNSCYKIYYVYNVDLRTLVSSILLWIGGVGFNIMNPFIKMLISFEKDVFYTKGCVFTHAQTHDPYFCIYIYNMYISAKRTEMKGWFQVYIYVCYIHIRLPGILQHLRVLHVKTLNASKCASF